MFDSSLPPVGCLIYVICVCLRIVVSNTYCAVFFLLVSSSCVYVASFSGLSMFYCSFGILLRLININIGFIFANNPGYEKDNATLTLFQLMQFEKVWSIKVP